MMFTNMYIIISNGDRRLKNAEQSASASSKEQSKTGKIGVYGQRKNK